MKALTLPQPSLSDVRKIAVRALQVAQSTYPDAGLTEKDIDDVWNTYLLDQRPDFAAQIQWTEHFTIMGKAGEHASLTQKLTALRIEVRELEAQVKSLKPLLRDQFAIAAMNGSCWQDGKEEDIAKSSYKQADAMLKEREAK